ncbi:hypothetical protein LTR50_006363 [Elasticomyces elasticus]|nr:hypothetical protein LTR50_006363 [Elasticomyces elasticus]
MSLRIAPSPSHPTTTAPSLGAPSAPGVHDTLRSNLSLTTPAPNATSTSSYSTPTVSQATSSHPLESRLAQWRQTQENLKMSLLRREFGLAEPVKRQMELGIVRAGEWRPRALGGMMGAGVHADVLSGRDTEIGWEDVFTGESPLFSSVTGNAAGGGIARNMGIRVLDSGRHKC